MYVYICVCVWNSLDWKGSSFSMSHSHDLAKIQRNRRGTLRYVLADNGATGRGEVFPEIQRFLLVKDGETWWNRGFWTFFWLKFDFLECKRRCVWVCWVFHCETRMLCIDVGDPSCLCKVANFAWADPHYWAGEKMFVWRVHVRQPLRQFSCLVNMYMSCCLNKSSLCAT